MGFSLPGPDLPEPHPPLNSSARLQVKAERGIAQSRGLGAAGGRHTEGSRETLQDETGWIPVPASWEGRAECVPGIHCLGGGEDQTYARDSLPLDAVVSTALFTQMFHGSGS